jgi:hypothetical protein
MRPSLTDQPSGIKTGRKQPIQRGNGAPINRAVFHKTAMG